MNPSSSKPIFKDMLKNKFGSSSTPPSTHSLESYVVEKIENTHMIEVFDPNIQGLHNAYSSNVIICRFNVF